MRYVQHLFAATAFATALVRARARRDDSAAAGHVNHFWVQYFTS